MNQVLAQKEIVLFYNKSFKYYSYGIIGYYLYFILKKLCRAIVLRIRAATVYQEGDKIQPSAACHRSNFLDFSAVLRGDLLLLALCTILLAYKLPVIAMDL